MSEEKPPRRAGKPNLPPPAVEAVAGPPDDRGRQIVVLEVGKDSDGYLVEPAAGDFGPCYTVTKVHGKPTKGNPGPYGVSLHGHCHCHCSGFDFRGTCRHVRGLLLLWSRGELYTAHHPLAQLARQDEAARKPESKESA